jgi:hypothetical protein
MDGRAARSIGGRETPLEQRPFQVGVSEGTLIDLRQRLAATPWAERVYPIPTYFNPKPTYFNEVDKGGHFAAWEVPGLFTPEVRASFRSLR